MTVRPTVPVLVALLAALPLAYAQRGAPPGPDTTRATLPAASTPAASTTVDARHCLAFETNPQVIACAEKYRPDRRRIG
jgi:hypothetical protein